MQGHHQEGGGVDGHLLQAEGNPVGQLCQRFDLGPVHQER